VYVATSNQIGNIYTGITSFVDPLGIIVQRANDTEDLIVGDASKQRIDYARATLPLLSQRRPHLYELR
jgi:predicted amidohydrolase